jgi:uncharacterized protein (TIGR02996 family)
MRTFEYDDGKSRKFWAIELQGNGFTVTFGRIGSAGKAQKKEFADAAKARKEHDKLVKEKLAKGYVEKAPPAPVSPTQRALEEALLQDPDNPATHAVNADYLMEQSDPHGELIQVQLALEDASKSPQARKQLRQREQALLEQHQRDWLGELAPFLLEQEGYQFQFGRGWLDSLTIPDLTVRLARVLARAPQTRLLRRLVILENSHSDEGEYEPGPDIPADSYWPGLHPLLKSPYLGNVRVFQLGAMEDDGPFNTYTSGEGAVALIAKMPRVEELHLFAHIHDEIKTLFGMKTLTHLRVLQVYHVEREHPLATLARNSALGRLTHLLLYPHGYSGSERGSYLPPEEVRALVRSPHLQSLTHLRLRLSNMGDEGCREIVRSGILKRLKVLDVRLGQITDEGARTLAACPELRNLESLDIGANWLTEEGVNALRAVGINVQADSQVAEGEDGYLMEGDME